MPSGVRDSKHVREHSIDTTPLEGRRIIILPKALHFQIVLTSLFIAVHRQLTRITTRLTLPVNQNPNALRPNYQKNEPSCVLSDLDVLKRIKVRYTSKVDPHFSLLASFKRLAWM